MPLYIARGNDSGAGEERTPLWWSPLYLDHLAVVFFFEDVRYSRSGLLPFIVLCVCMCVCSQWVKVLVSQSCLTLWDPMDCSLPGPSILGIFQARLLEWIAIPFSRGSSLPWVEPGFPSLQADSLPSESPGKPSRAHMRKRHTLHFRGLECKSRKSSDTKNNRQV